ncbi:hypothetical protein [Haloarchaeobius sp. TZWSO28]|uniref:hypothetical protein n=1 Tax=Haloarchaeobius sp. TZWSO28 TaxID=3446119 RepID=UPI003EC0D19E
MSVERPQGPDRLDKHRETIENRLHVGPLRFPDDWTMTGSWQRAQAAPAECGPINASQFDVLIGYTDSDELGERHRVTFAIHGGQLVADCDCEAWKWRDWCAHVAHLWWRWSRERLVVTDLDTGRNHRTPPVWLNVDEPNQPTASATRAVTDGGVRR